MEIKLSTYSETGLFVAEYIDFPNGKIFFHQGEESVQNEEVYGHSAFDKIIEYDIDDIDNMIEALEKHYEEKQYPDCINMEKLNAKSKKLLNYVFSFYTDERNFYWEDLMIEIFDSSKLTKNFAEQLRTDVKNQGYRPKKAVYKTLSDLF